MIIIVCLLASLCLLSYIAYGLSTERFQTRSPNVYTLDPKSLALNPMGNVQQIMLNLQNPRDCKTQLENVVDNPNVSEEDMQKLYNCVNNPYDLYLIRSLPFGNKGGA